MIYANEEYLWFGTEEKMGWIDSPLRQPDESPTGWTNEQALLSGGAFIRGSFGSHKKYDFTWSDATSLETVQLVMSYANGTYGRGPIYFLDPFTYETNCLPAHVAAPGLATEYDSRPLLKNTHPSAVASNVSVASGLPVTSARYNLQVVGDSESEKIFIPVPTGMSAYVGAIYSATGSAGVYVTPVTALGDGTPVRLTELSTSTTQFVNAEFPDVIGIRIFIQKTTVTASQLTLNALLVRIAEPDLLTTPSDRATKIIETPWCGGQGNAGTRFVGKPTLIAYNGIGGGQYGLACTLKEVDE